MSGQRDAPMVRLVPVALLLASVMAPATGQNSPKPNPWRLTSPSTDARTSPRLPGADVGANGRIGLGMFGLKSEHLLPSTTAREIATPKSRRAGFGFSLKF
jgi:hypothetical protein